MFFDPTADDWFALRRGNEKTAAKMNYIP